MIAIKVQGGRRVGSGGVEEGRRRSREFDEEG